MAYDFGSEDLLAPEATPEEADPRVGLVNLADVMLVFACGLMLALVSYWNLDISSMSELNQSDMKPLEDAEEIVETAQSSAAYIERGTVYEDPNTGKLYYMQEVDADGNPVESENAGGGTGTNTGTGAGGAAGAGSTMPPNVSGEGSAPTRAQGAD
jgi:hypothetical protein